MGAGLKPAAFGLAQPSSHVCDNQAWSLESVDPTVSTGTPNRKIAKSGLLPIFGEKA